MVLPKGATPLPISWRPKKNTPSISHVVYAQSYTKFDLRARLRCSGRVYYRSTIAFSPMNGVHIGWYIDMVSTNNPGHRESAIHTGIKLHCTVCATCYAQIENSATTCDALLEFITF